MSEVKVTVFDNGPIEVAGPVTLVDENGEEIPHDADEPIYLCRCGQSSDKPFCDGTHSECDFQSVLTR